LCSSFETFSPVVIFNSWLQIPPPPHLFGNLLGIIEKDLKSIIENISIKKEMIEGARPQTLQHSLPLVFRHCLRLSFSFFQYKNELMAQAHQGLEGKKEDGPPNFFVLFLHLRFRSNGSVTRDLVIDRSIGNRPFRLFPPSTDLRVSSSSAGMKSFPIECRPPRLS
jgi:hypothetical protein